MSNVIKKAIRGYLKAKKINTIRFGKNRGFRYKFNEDLNLDMMLGFHEPNTFEVFDLFIKEGMNVADVGANIGYFSRFLSRKVGPKGKIFAFEPMPATFAMYQETVSLNQLTNIVPVNAAVSDTDGTVKMYFSHTHYMASVDVNWASNKGGEIEVKSLRLDTYFEEKGFFPDFIKLDIEGGGVFALEGMKNCIVKNQPVLFLESHTLAEDLAIGKALSLIPYEVYRVGDSEPVVHLDRDYTDKGGIYSTVIAIPKSKLHVYGNLDPSSFQKKRIGQR